MKIIPLADRVVIKTVEVEETTKGGLNFNGLDNNTVCKRNDLHSSCPPIIKYNENFFWHLRPIPAGSPVV